MLKDVPIKADPIIQHRIGILAPRLDEITGRKYQERQLRLNITRGAGNTLHVNISLGGSTIFTTAPAPAH